MTFIRIGISQNESKGDRYHLTQYLIRWYLSPFDSFNMCEGIIEIMEFGNIKLIAFDIDGTLAETDDYFVEKGAVIMRKIMPFVSKQKMENVVRLPMMVGETILHAIYRLLDLVGLDTLISKTHSHFSVNGEYNYAEVTGMRSTLKKLHENYLIGVITSGGRHSTEAFIKKFELGEYVEFVVSAEDCEYIKPHPAPLLKIADEAHVSPENCILVGDTIFDILCAKRAGAVSVAVKSGFDTEKFLKMHNADLILANVNELPKVLE